MKLIRDKLAQTSAAVHVSKIVEPNMLMRLLRAKLLEEAVEVMTAEYSSQTLEELADVVEVVQAIAELHGRTFGDVVETARRKRDVRGGFDGGFVLTVGPASYGNTCACGRPISAPKKLCDVCTMREQ